MPQSKERLTAHYERHSKFIRKLTSKFYSRYGGDWEELHAEALWWFVKACQTWKASRGPLNKHISFRIWTGLLELRRTKARQQLLDIEDAPTESIARHSTSFIDLYDELSDDAKTVVRHVLRPDLDLALMMGTREGFRAERRALREYLKDWEPKRFNRIIGGRHRNRVRIVRQALLEYFDLGDSPDRISAAFTNIERAITPKYAERTALGEWLDSTHVYR